MENNKKENTPEKKYLDENISELEKKELEKFDSFLDDEDKDKVKDFLNDESEKNKIKTNKNINVTIFKSIDFNDFPKTKLEKTNNNQKKIEININLNKKKIEDDDLLEEKEYDDLDNEINLEEQLKKEYEGDDNKDNEKINEDISDNELMSMSKENIIQYKNYQILKLKTVIKNLRQEKESLIANYKQTTDNLLKHIKELEFKGTGERPMTAKIVNKIVSSSASTSDMKNKVVENERCPNCGKIIKNNFMEHSLECIRKKYKCIYCNELMNIEEKEKHNESFYDKKKLYESIINRNNDYIIKALKHDFPINDTVLDDKTGDYFIHLIIKYKNFGIIKKYDNTLNVNLENKQKETPLFMAIDNEDINSIKELLFLGADIKKRNKSDLSPLMLCCKKNYQNIAELLIIKGANVNEKNILGDTPVKIAQLNGNEELALKLIKLYKAEIN